MIQYYWTKNNCEYNIAVTELVTGKKYSTTNSWDSPITSVWWWKYQILWYAKSNNLEHQNISALKFIIYLYLQIIIYIQINSFFILYSNV